MAVTIDEDDERTLVAAAQADPARFEELYDRYVHRVFGFVSRRVGNRATAEDITSAVFEQALASLPKFEWRGVPFAAWLIRIASNAVTDHWRKTARETGDAAEMPDAGEMARCSSWSTGCRICSGGSSSCASARRSRFARSRRRCSGPKGP